MIKSLRGLLSEIGPKFSKHVLKLANILTFEIFLSSKYVFGCLQESFATMAVCLQLWRSACNSKNLASQNVCFKDQVSVKSFCGLMKGSIQGFPKRPLRIITLVTILRDTPLHLLSVVSRLREKGGYVRRTFFIFIHLQHWNDFCIFLFRI